MKLKEIRTRKGLSASKLSALSGVPMRTIQDIERTGQCRLETAARLSRALGTTVNELLDEAYEGRYQAVYLDDVLNTIIGYMNPESVEKMVKDLNYLPTHIPAMNRAYDFYEQVKDHGLTHITW